MVNVTMITPLIFFIASKTFTIEIYLNAKVSQLSLKCYFLVFKPFFYSMILLLTSPMICRQYNMKIRPVRLKIADLQQEMQGNPNWKSHRVTIPYILSSHSVTPPYILFGNGVEPLSVFKSRRVDKSRQVILCIW